MEEKNVKNVTINKKDYLIIISGDGCFNYEDGVIGSYRDLIDEDYFELLYLVDKFLKKEHVHSITKDYLSDDKEWSKTTIKGDNEFTLIIYNQKYQSVEWNMFKSYLYTRESFVMEDNAINHYKVKLGCGQSSFALKNDGPNDYIQLNMSYGDNSELSLYDGWFLEEFLSDKISTRKEEIIITENDIKGFNVTCGPVMVEFDNYQFLPLVTDVIKRRNTISNSEKIMIKKGE